MGKMKEAKDLLLCTRRNNNEVALIKHDGVRFVVHCAKIFPYRQELPRTVSRR